MERPSLITHSFQETQKAGEEFAKSLVGAPLGAPQLRVQKKKQVGVQQAAPLLIGLKGDLGAGKTTFVKGMAKAFDISDVLVTSPTFTLIQEYGPIIHIDLYRLEKEEELIFLGLEEMALPGKVMVIEWYDKFPKYFEHLDACVHIEPLGESERKITIP